MWEHLDPSLLMVLLWKVVEPLGRGASLEEVTLLGTGLESGVASGPPCFRTTYVTLT